MPYVSYNNCTSLILIKFPIHWIFKSFQKRNHIWIITYLSFSLKNFLFFTHLPSATHQEYPINIFDRSSTSFNQQSILNERQTKKKKKKETRKPCNRGIISITSDYHRAGNMKMTLVASRVTREILRKYIERDWSRDESRCTLYASRYLYNRMIPVRVISGIERVRKLIGE